MTEGHIFVYRLQPSEVWTRLADGRMLVDSPVRGRCVVHTGGMIEAVEPEVWVDLRRQPLAFGYLPRAEASS